MDLVDLLRSDCDDEDDGAVISHEGQIARLCEAADRFAAPVIFKVGDLVTPLKDSPLKSAGAPCLVIDVDEEADYRFFGEPGSFGYGARYNIRTLSVIRDTIVAHWNEAAYFKRYTGEAV